MRPETHTAAIVSMMLVGLAGCAAPEAHVRVTQPQLTGLQREMDLHSEWGSFDGGGERPRRLLLAFPLPGAWAGTRHFLLYVRLPGDAETTAQVGDLTSDGPVAGFFVQTRGHAAGLTRVVDGTVTVEGVTFGGDAWCEGTFELVTDDGSHLDGRYRAKRSRFRLRDFEEEEYRGDVEALRAAASNSSQPTTRPGGPQTPG